jgi:hypothetical protein
MLEIAQSAAANWNLLYGAERRGDRRCAALSRSVQRPKGARSTAMLEIFTVRHNTHIDYQRKNPTVAERWWRCL